MRKSLGNKVNLTDYFDQIDKSKAPNLKQYLLGVRNYYILSGT